MCVTCLEGVCWQCNWAQSCVAVCYECYKAELKCEKCKQSKEHDCECDSDARFVTKYVMGMGSQKQIENL